MPRKLAKETSLALKKIGAKETINSGVFGDGDAEIIFKNPLSWGAYDGATIESKFTEKMSFSIKSDTLEKVEKEADRKAYLPVLLIGLINRKKEKIKYVVLRESDYRDIIDWIDFLQLPREE